MANVPSNKNPLMQKKHFFGNIINSSVSGVKHLGFAIRSITFKEGYIKSKVESWSQQYEILSKITTELQLQAAYLAYINIQAKIYNFFT